MPLSVPVDAIAVERSQGALGRAAVAMMQGIRNHYEDAHLLDQSGRACGVFDGHLGDEASAFLAERLQLHVSAAGPLSHEALVAAFAACDEEMQRVLPEGSHAGSCATYAAVVPAREGSADGELLVWTASCGDSRAVLWRRGDDTVEVTRDHRPEVEGERRRIEAAGGFVSDGDLGARVDGELGCSRALGDFRFKQDTSLPPGDQKVSSVPEVYEWHARAGDWLLLGCDGVWDTLRVEEVVDRVCRTCCESGSDIGDALAAALEFCLRRDADDNLSLLAVELGAAAQEQPSAVQVSPGCFARVRDKEAAEQYVAFCRRFGYVLTKELVPKAPPVASLAAADPLPPAARFGGLPRPGGRAGLSEAESQAGPPRSEP